CSSLLWLDARKPALTGTDNFDDLPTGANFYTFVRCEAPLSTSESVWFREVGYERLETSMPQPGGGCCFCVGRAGLFTGSDRTESDSAADHHQRPAFQCRVCHRAGRRHAELHML